MNLRNRLAALEAALAGGGAADEPDDLFRDPRYVLEMSKEILRHRAVPLPPLDGVSIDATAELWAREGETHERLFVMDDGTTCDSAELFRRAGSERCGT